MAADEGSFNWEWKTSWKQNLDEAKARRCRLFGTGQRKIALPELPEVNNRDCIRGKESQSSRLTADKRIASSTHSHIATGRKGVTDTISRIVDCEEFLLANESPGISHYSRLVRKWQTWQTRPSSAIGLSRVILHLYRGCWSSTDLPSSSWSLLLFWYSSSASRSLHHGLVSYRLDSPEIVCHWLACLYPPWALADLHMPVSQNRACRVQQLRCSKWNHPHLRQHRGEMWMECWARRGCTTEMKIQRLHSEGKVESWWSPDPAILLVILPRMS